MAVTSLASSGIDAAAHMLYFTTLAGTGLILIASLSGAFASRFGAPLLLLFLLIGVAAGATGIGVHIIDADTAFFVGSLALAIILFDSGFGTPLRMLRLAAGPAGTLATLGVVLTAGLAAIASHLLLGLPWLHALLFGAIISSTDAAAVFFLLRAGGIHVGDRVRATLEVESGANDPMAIFLTLALAGLISAIGAQGEASQGLVDLLVRFILQAGIGLAAGLLGGLAIVSLLRRVPLEPGLVPVFAVALSLLVFAATGLLGGSGFLAAYVSGLVAGNNGLYQAASMRRFQEGLTWLAQIVMFLALGLFASPSEFLGVLLNALLLAAFLIIVARPLSVWLCLLPFRFTRAEALFTGWVGLRGAVSILLALVPVMSGLDHAETIFNTVFIIVLVSLGLQGWTIAPVARRLGLIVPELTGAVEKIEVELPGTVTHELLGYTVAAKSPVANGAPLPRWARPSLILRHGVSMKLAEAGALQAGDRVYLFVAPNYPRLLDRLFARPAALSADETEFFGEFSVAPEHTLGEVALVYGIELGGLNAQTSISDFLDDRLGGLAVTGDRVALGTIELIVRDLDVEGRILSVGLELEPQSETSGRTNAGDWLGALLARLAPGRNTR
jgi:potassium/hydrogen antiporter